MSGYREHDRQQFDQKWPSHLLTSAAGAASVRIYFWLWAEVLKQSFKKNTRGTVPNLWRNKHNVRGTGCASKGVQVTIWTLKSFVFEKHSNSKVSQWVAAQTRDSFCVCSARSQATTGVTGFSRASSSGGKCDRSGSSSHLCQKRMSCLSRPQKEKHLTKRSACEGHSLLPEMSNFLLGGSSRHRDISVGCPSITFTQDAGPRYPNQPYQASLNRF